MEAAVEAAVVVVEAVVEFSPVLQACRPASASSAVEAAVEAAVVVVEAVVEFSPVLQACRPFGHQPYCSFITRLAVASHCSFSFGFSRI